MFENKDEILPVVLASVGTTRGSSGGGAGGSGSLGSSIFKSMKTYHNNCNMTRKKRVIKRNRKR